MPRPVWTGTISFGLVAIPVKLFHAVARKNVRFNQLDDRSMARIRYQKVSAATGELVPDDHIVKGYEISKDQYVVVDPDELEPFIPAATKTVELEEFVELEQIDPVYFDAAYHVAPGTNPKPYVLLARAMEESGKVAIGRFVMRNKQYTAAIRAQDGRLVMSTLAYADEVVDADTIEELGGLDDVEVNDKEVLMAEALVESLSADFEPDKYHDEYREQVLDLIEAKAAGQELMAPTAAAEAPKVVDLMAALEASVNAAKAARARHPAAKGRAEPDAPGSEGPSGDSGSSEVGGGDGEAAPASTSRRGRSKRSTASAAKRSSSGSSGGSGSTKKAAPKKAARKKSA